MIGLDPITITNGASATINLPRSPTYGMAQIGNESPYPLRVSIPGHNFWVPAGGWGPLDLTVFGFQSTITLTPQLISSSLNPPSTVALVNLYAPKEPLIDFAPFVRLNNIGNGVITTSAVTAVQNDGNPAGTQVLEATPAGQPSSAFFFDNSGNITWRTLSVNVWTTMLSIVAGSAVAAATALFSTLVEIGSGSLNKLSMHDLGGNTNEAGVISSGTFATLAAPTGILQRYNSYSDGTNDRFMTANNAAQIAFSLAAFGGTAPHPGIRFSNNAPSIGGTITYGPFFGLAFMVNNNLQGGKHIFTGTTTPSGPVTGDLWFNG